MDRFEQSVSLRLRAFDFGTYKCIYIRMHVTKKRKIYIYVCTHKNTKHYIYPHTRTKKYVKACTKTYKCRIACRENRIFRVPPRVYL